MMFGDDISICGDTREEFERKLESWRRVLEEGAQASRKKTEHRVDRSLGTGQVGRAKTRPIFPPTLIFRKHDLIRFQMLLHLDVCLERTSTHMLKPYT